MCDPDGAICPEMAQTLQHAGIGPNSSPRDHPDMVIEIATCAARTSEYTSYYPYRSMGWAGFKEHDVKRILTAHGWTFVGREDSPDGRARFLRP